MLYVNPLARPALARMDHAQSDEAREAVALKELEHLFAFELLKEMRKTVPEGTLLDSGPEFDAYQDMFYDALSGAFAESGQLGLARQLAEQLRIAETMEAAAPRPKV